MTGPGEATSGPRRRLRLEPWGVGHAGSLQDGGDPGVDDPGPDDGATLTDAAVSVELPLGDWRGLRPAAPTRIGRALFLDGVRRVEARGMLEGDRQVFAALGGCAVGAVECRLAGEAPARFVGEPIIERWCVIATDELVEPDLEIPSGAGAAPLRYRAVAAAGTEYQAPVEHLQRLMREAEGRLASNLRIRMAEVDGADPRGGTSILICDGPRPFVGADARVVGYLKTVQRQRLPGAAFEVVKRLEEGERSPIYLVGQGGNARFEWYVRLRDPRPWLHSLAGSVRLQAHAGERPAELLAAAQGVADWSAEHLPRFGTRAHQDPRAPQQLLPVHALEETLRRRLGSAPLLRRRIEVALAEGVAAHA